MSSNQFRDTLWRVEGRSKRDDGPGYSKEDGHPKRETANIEML